MARLITHQLGLNDEKLVAILAHGGGGLPFSPNSPLLKFVTTHARPSCVICIQLPCHGAGSAMEIPEVGVVVDDLASQLRPLTEGKRVLMVSYSLGGMLSMKVWGKISSLWHPSSVFAFIGSSFSAGVNVEQVLWYWSEQGMTQMGKSKGLQALHGEQWKTVVKLVNTWSRADSGIWLSPQERDALIKHPNTYWINGKFDQPYPPNEIYSHINAKEALLRCFVVPSDHFTYFSQHWELVSAVLKVILGNADPTAGPSVTKPKL